MDVNTGFILPRTGLELRNRAVLAAITNKQSGLDGVLSDAEIGWLHRRAEGGFGIVTTAASHVHPSGKSWEGEMGVWGDHQLPKLTELAEGIRERGALSLVQIFHGGLRAPRSLTGQQPVSASENTEHGVEEESRGLSDSEISDLVDAFAEAAERCERAGFDGVEVHGAHGYLVSSFFSPLANHRTDEYGGDIKARSRFGCEMTEAIRAAIPNETALFIRINGSDLAAGGSDPEEMAVAAEMLHAAGADVIDVSAGGNSPEAPSIQSLYPGYQLEIAATIKRLAVVPTIAVGMIRSPAMAEEIVQNGRADLVAIGREMLGNPYWPRIAARKLGAAMEWPEQYETAW